MTKAELISAIAEKTELTKKDSGKALDALTAVITETLAKGDKVVLLRKKGGQEYLVLDRVVKA